MKKLLFALILVFSCCLKGNAQRMGEVFVFYYDTVKFDHGYYAPAENGEWAEYWHKDEVKFRYRVVSDDGKTLLLLDKERGLYVRITEDQINCGWSKDKIKEFFKTGGWKKRRQGINNDSLKISYPSYFEFLLNGNRHIVGTIDHAHRTWHEIDMSNGIVLNMFFERNAWTDKVILEAAAEKNGGKFGGTSFEPLSNFLSYEITKGRIGFSYQDPGRYGRDMEYKPMASGKWSNGVYYSPYRAIGNSTKDSLFRRFNNMPLFREPIEKSGYDILKMQKIAEDIASHYLKQIKNDYRKFMPWYKVNVSYFDEKSNRMLLQFNDKNYYVTVSPADGKEFFESRALPVTDISYYFDGSRFVPSRFKIKAKASKKVYPCAEAERTMSRQEFKIGDLVFKCQTSD